MRTSLSLIALLLAGCGGGGSNDPVTVTCTPAGGGTVTCREGGATVVSPSPPPPIVSAPAPASPSPAPPPIAQPAPVQTPATPPAVEPPAEIPPAPPPVAQPPAVVIPPATPTFVGANVVGPSLAMLLTGPVGPQTQGQMVGGTTTAYIAQTSHRNPFGPSTYYFSSGNPETFRDDPAQPSSVPPDATHLAKTYLRTTDAPTDAAGTWLGSNMVADGWELTRKEGGFSASGDLPLNTVLARWSVGILFAELRINPDTDSALYRLCWRVSLPNINRLSCGKFDKLTAEFRGIYVSDASYAGGPVIWETQ